MLGLVTQAAVYHWALEGIQIRPTLFLFSFFCMKVWENNCCPSLVDARQPCSKKCLFPLSPHNQTVTIAEMAHNWENSISSDHAFRVYQAKFIVLLCVLYDRWFGTDSDVRPYSQSYRKPDHKLQMWSFWEVVGSYWNCSRSSWGIILYCEVFNWESYIQH